MIGITMITRMYVDVLEKCAIATFLDHPL